MERPHAPQKLTLHLFFGSVVVGLFFLATLAGYVSNNDAPLGPTPPLPVSPPVTMQTSRSEPPDGLETIAPHPTLEPEGDVDPVASYKHALSLLEANYYSAPVDNKKARLLTYEAIRGMLTSLRDQFTTFLDPAEWSQMQALTKGDFEGIGAYLDQKSRGFVRVVRPIPTSSAESRRSLLLASGSSAWGSGADSLVPSK